MSLPPQNKRKGFVGAPPQEPPPSPSLLDQLKPPAPSPPPKGGLTDVPPIMEPPPPPKSGISDQPPPPKETVSAPPKGGLTDAPPIMEPPPPVNIPPPKTQPPIKVGGFQDKIDIDPMIDPSKNLQEASSLIPPPKVEPPKQKEKVETQSEMETRVRKEIQGIKNNLEWQRLAEKKEYDTRMEAKRQTMAKANEAEVLRMQQEVIDMEARSAKKRFKTLYGDPKAQDEVMADEMVTEYGALTLSKEEIIDRGRQMGWGGVEITERDVLTRPKEDILAMGYAKGYGGADKSVRDRMKGTIAGELLALSEKGGRLKEESRKRGDVFSEMLQGGASIIVEGTAGFVGAAESLVEILPEEWRPEQYRGKNIADVGGALIGSAQESGIRVKIEGSRMPYLDLTDFKAKASEEQKYLEKHPIYTAGAIIGEIATGIVLGAAVSKGAKAASKAGGAVAKAPKKLASYTKKELDKFGMTKTERRVAERVAKAEKMAPFEEEFSRPIFSREQIKVELRTPESQIPKFKTRPKLEPKEPLDIPKRGGGDIEIGAAADFTKKLKKLPKADEARGSFKITYPDEKTISKLDPSDYASKSKQAKTIFEKPKFKQPKIETPPKTKYDAENVLRPIKKTKPNKIMVVNPDRDLQTPPANLLKAKKKMKDLADTVYGTPTDETQILTTPPGYETPWKEFTGQRPKETPREGTGKTPIITPSPPIEKPDIPTPPKLEPPGLKTPPIDKPDIPPWNPFKGGERPRPPILKPDIPTPPKLEPPGTKQPPIEKPIQIIPSPPIEMPDLETSTITTPKLDVPPIQEPKQPDLVIPRPPYRPPDSGSFYKFKAPYWPRREVKRRKGSVGRKGKAGLKLYPLLSVGDVVRAKDILGVKNMRVPKYGDPFKVSKDSYGFGVSRPKSKRKR